jgi:ATP-dependent helicase HepA
MNPTDRTPPVKTDFPFQVGHKVRLVLGHEKLLAEIYQPPKNDKVAVVWYNGPGQTERKTVPLTDIQLAPLISQQRVYIEPGDYWRHGRIVVERDRPKSSKLRLYTIALPGGEKVELFEDQFHVHNDVTHPDPFDALMGLASETPFLCEHRARFVKALIEQRAVCAGMTGLMSARVDFISHQIDTVRRVLQDPRQRYLLADEVGLGKTIESGIIINQLLQDDPEATVLVLTPNHLLDQWKNELNHRFDLDLEEEDDRVQVLTHDDLAELKEIPELLIVDEAHHLVRGDAKRKKQAEKLCTKVPRLLLLSATPVLGQERELLTLLSWLEPHLYSPDDEKTFKQRVEERQTIGNELLLLRPGMPSLRLKNSLKRLQELFGGKESRFNDPHVVELCEEILKLTEKEKKDQPLIDRKITELRLHISECYRLHRRLIRHRRRGLPTTLSKREIARHEGDLDPDLSSAVGVAFDQWRDHVAFHARELSETKQQQWESIFTELLQALVHPPWAMELIKARVKPDKIGEEDEAPLQVVTALALCDGEEKLLKELSSKLKQIDNGSDRISLLCMLFKSDAKRFPRVPKTVIFTRSKFVANALSDRIRSTVFLPVCLLLGGMESEKIAEEVNLFRTEAARSVLICDATGAEGLNLQIAERIVHFDLPLDPFAIEQRIGRLDRLTRVAARVPNIVITTQSEPGAFDDAWLGVLRDGFQLFSDSISDLNLYADRRLPALIRQGFQQGVQAWQEAIPTIKSEIETERQAIDSQDAIDAVDLNPDATEQLFKKLNDYEQDLGPFIDAINGYLKLLNRIDQYKLQKALPHQQVRWHAIDNVLMREDWYKEISSFLLKKFQYDRSEAQRDRESLFLRLGHPFIDKLNRFAMRDDRGKAFIMWRPLKGYKSTDLFFRIDVIVEADSRKLEAGLQELDLPISRRKELSRLADSFYPPRVESYYLDEELELVENPQTLSWLKRAYDKRTGDRNIARARVQVLVDELGRDRWTNSVQAVREKVHKLIEQAPTHKKECATGASRAHQYFAQRIDQVKLGARYQEKKVVKELLEIEESLQKTMEAAIQEPTVRIDAVGAILLSGKLCPEVPEEDE